MVVQTRNINDVVVVGVRWIRANPSVKVNNSCGGYERKSSCDDLIEALLKYLDVCDDSHIRAWYAEIVEQAGGVDKLLRFNMFYDFNDISVVFKVNDFSFMKAVIVREVANQVAVDHGLTQALRRSLQVIAA